MTNIDPQRDLTLTRVIKASRAAVWRAWAEPTWFEQWWIPAPMTLKVVEMDLRPGGAFHTLMSEDGKSFAPHMDACFLSVEPMERIVFTTGLSGGWRPIENPYPMSLTAIITLTDHAEGMEYAAHVMHGGSESRDRHETMGFHEGWGTVVGQLARLVEG